MTEDPGNRASQQQWFQFTARGIGGGIGGLIGFGGCRLAGFDDFWPCVIIGVGFAIAGGSLAQKLAGK